jgi:hypothetical protein
MESQIILRSIFYEESGVLDNIYNYVGKNKYLQMHINKEWLLIYLKKYNQRSGILLIDELILNDNIERLKIILNFTKVDINAKYYIYISLAKNGYVNCLKYLYENGHKWENRICYFASQNGHLDCLKYLHKSGCKLNSNLYIAGKKGYLECLKYLLENECKFDYDSAAYAAEGGYLKCLEYLHMNGCPMTYNTIQAAAENGKLECLKWLYKNHCPWNYNIFNRTVFNGQVDCLKWLDENCIISNNRKGSLCANAAYNGHIECLKYLYEKSYPMCSNVIRHAINNNHLNCLKYARANKCPEPNSYFRL